MDRDAFRIQSPGKFLGISAAFNIGDLGGCESHHFIVLVIPEIDIEIVEVAPGGAHDEGTDWHSYSLINCESSRNSHNGFSVPATILDVILHHFRGCDAQK